MPKIHLAFQFLCRKIYAWPSLLMLAGCAVLPVQPPPVEYAKIPLPNCSLEMAQSEFWLQRLAHPDRPLLLPDEIAALNRNTFQRDLLTDVFSKELWDYEYQEVDRLEELDANGEENKDTAITSPAGLMHAYTLYTYLKDETERIKKKTRWDVKGQPLPPDFFTGLDANLNLEGIHEDNPIRYGITRRRTDVRYYPSPAVVLGDSLDINFDLLQVSALGALQPVAILHTSRDKKWLFVVTAYCRGWVNDVDIVADCRPEDIQRFIKPGQPLVITGHKVEAVWVPGTTLTAEKAYLGTAYPLLAQEQDYYCIALPQKEANGRLGYCPAYISRQAEVHVGYLPCTSRTIIELAFRQLHYPYSWGGKGEYRDCSQFIMDLFATMGILFPRNSSLQCRLGRSFYMLARKDSEARRRADIDHLDQPALLHFPGHIMLYLGQSNGNYYVIHDIWSYRIADQPAKDRKLIIGQVVVSDLSLGAGSTKGSFFERLTTINLLRP